MKILFTFLGVLFVMTNLNAKEFQLTSSDLKEKNMKMEQVYSGCGGSNISPELRWENAPKNTKSFAINVYDPDAPTGSGWWHWVVFNIPANVNKLKKGVSLKDLPKGAIESITDWGKSGYDGACPPKGDKPHRYIFTIYALDVDKLNADAKTMPAAIGFQVNAHTITKSSLTVYYGN